MRLASQPLVSEKEKEEAGGKSDLSSVAAHVLCACACGSPASRHQPASCALDSICISLCEGTPNLPTPNEVRLTGCAATCALTKFLVNQVRPPGAHPGGRGRDGHAGGAAAAQQHLLRRALRGGLGRRRRGCAQCFRVRACTFVLQQLNNISCGGRCAVGSGGAAVGAPSVLGLGPAPLYCSSSTTSPAAGAARWALAAPPWVRRLRSLPIRLG